MGYIEKSAYALKKMSKTALIKRMLYLQRLLVWKLDLEDVEAIEKAIKEHGNLG